MKLMQWLIEHPKAMMDIGNKVLIIVAALVIIVYCRRRETCRKLFEKSMELKDSTYQTLSMQYDDMSNRLTVLIKTHNRLEDQYYELKQNQEQAIHALRKHFEHSDSITRDEINELVGGYIGFSNVSQS